MYNCINQNNLIDMETLETMAFLCAFIVKFEKIT